jgi:hypothetical protein
MHLRKTSCPVRRAGPVNTSREFSRQALPRIGELSAMQSVPVHAQDGGIDHLHRLTTAAGG